MASWKPLPPSQLQRAGKTIAAFTLLPGLLACSEFVNATEKSTAIT
ncbi:MAG: hypothetical protein JWP58_2386 [Hymenobacter sp.]|nr:hypothetical protein [Hymenobacter sp.]